MAKTSGKRMAVEALAAGLFLSVLALVGSPGSAETTSTETVVRPAARSIHVEPTKKAKKAKKAKKGAKKPAATAPAPVQAQFMNRNADGTPIRYNPCAPIHYVANGSARRCV